jgi:hypothetical protein
MVGSDATSGRQRMVFGFAVLAVLAAGGALALALLSPGSSPSGPAADFSPTTSLATSPPAPTAIPTPTPIRHAAILDGVPMSDDEWEARKDLLPLAVMVDNSPSAMPQVGLDKADLVFEAFVEGTITRFMAVFWRQEANHVEPVRSARTPFVIWVDELGALYAHAGGAQTDNEANAIGQIAEWGIKDLNAFGSGADGAYYRDGSRYSPYNLVAQTPALREAATGMGFAGPSAVEPWPFKADGQGTSGDPAAAGIEVNFRDYRVPWQLVQWHWDETSKAYLRFEGGGPHLDAESKQQLQFTNVVVMRVPWSVVDESGHALLDQFGEGPASVFLDGRVIDGKWMKKDRAGRTRFFDAAGIEIAFNRGPIFIEVVGPESLVTVSPSVEGLPPIPPYEPPPPYVPEPEETPSPTPTSEASPSPSPGPSPTGVASKTPTPPPASVATPAPSTSSTIPPSSTAPSSH